MERLRIKTQHLRLAGALTKVFCSCFLFFLSPYPVYPLSSVFTSLIPLQHTTQTSKHSAGFCCCCCLSVCLCPDCPGFCLLSLLYKTHNTNIHAPGGIRTRNSSKRHFADLRLRRVAHRDWPESKRGLLEFKSYLRRLNQTAQHSSPSSCPLSGLRTCLLTSS